MQNSILKSLAQLRKQTADYSNLIFFFIAFSIFIIFIIRPSLNTAFTRSKRLGDLATLEKQYEVSIGQVVSFQSQLQTINNDIPLLDAAIPVDPNINQLLADIRLAATQTDVVLNRTDVGEIQLVRDKKTGVVSSILVSMDATTSYPNFKAFHNTLSKQKRLKKITSLEITRAGSAIASTSAGLKINMEIEAYYL